MKTIKGSFVILSCLTFLSISGAQADVEQAREQQLEGATSVQILQDGYGFSVGLSGDYLFEYDQDTLGAKSIQALENVLAIYQEYDGFQIDISGHTDSRGSDNYNQELSDRRADRVFQWFRSQGVPSSSLSKIGHGETRPVADNERDGNDYPEGRALNRRVEITARTTEQITELPSADGRLEPSPPIVPEPPTIDSVDVPEAPNANRVNVPEAPRPNRVNVPEAPRPNRVNVPEPPSASNP